MSRILVQSSKRLQRQGFQDQKSFFHTRSQIDAAAAAAQKAKPQQSEPVEAADAKKSGDSKAVATPAKAPSEKVLRLVNELADLSIVDFVDLTEQLKNRLGLNNTNISVPMMMPAGMMLPGMGAAAPAAAAAPAEEEKPVEKQVFDIKLEKYEAADKIKVIKEVRAFTSLGLKEAKDLVDKLPAIVKKSVTKDEAAAILAKLKAAGGHAIME